MCGIFGSNNINTFRELCLKNSVRGNFVRSVTKLFPGGMKNDTRVSTKYEQDVAYGKFSGFVSHYHISKSKIDCAGLNIKTLLDEVKYDIDILDKIKNS